jgi:hypothetical protein
MSETFLMGFLCKFQANNKAGFLPDRQQYFAKILFGIRLAIGPILGKSP